MKINNLCLQVETANDIYETQIEEDLDPNQDLSYYYHEYDAFSSNDFGFDFDFGKCFLFIAITPGPEKNVFIHLELEITFSYSFNYGPQYLKISTLTSVILILIKSRVAIRSLIMVKLMNSYSNSPTKHQARPINLHRWVHT